MKAKVASRNGKKFIHIIRSSDTSVDDIRTSRTELELLLRKEGTSLLLSDCREVDFSVVSVIEADNLARDLKDEVPKCKSMAVICRSPSENLFAHFCNVCAYYGINVRFFSELESALSWLCSE